MNPRFLLASCLACLLVFSLAGVALAHAELVESDPSEGETIRTPATLTAYFSEDLDHERSRVIVRNAAGEEVASGGVIPLDDRLMGVDLPQLEPGEYVARWTAVTPDDGGVTRGMITFSVEAAPPTPSPAPATDGPSTPEPTEAPTPAPTASPALGPSPSPTPDGEPTAGMTDLLLALVLAGAVIGGVALYLLRRR